MLEILDIQYTRHIWTASSYFFAIYATEFYVGFFIWDLIAMSFFDMSIFQGFSSFDNFMFSFVMCQIFFECIFSIALIAVVWCWVVMSFYMLPSVCVAIKLGLAAIPTALYLRFMMFRPFVLFQAMKLLKGFRTLITLERFFTVMG